jgi:hypothetical protein
MSEEGVEYRGYHLDVHRFGSSWRVRVYGPGDRYPMPGAPETRSEDGEDQVLRQARQTVDRHLRTMVIPFGVADAPPVQPRRRWGWRSFWRKPS